MPIKPQAAIARTTAQANKNLMSLTIVWRAAALLATDRQADSPVLTPRGGAFLCANAAAVPSVLCRRRFQRAGHGQGRGPALSLKGWGPGGAGTPDETIVAGGVTLYIDDREEPFSADRAPRPVGIA